MFYAPRGRTTGSRHARRTRPHYLLIWDTELADAPAPSARELVVLATSEGTDPRGRQHLVLARLDS
jgi:hypothetical protein